MRSVISTAKTQTRFIGNPTISANLTGSGFRFSDLKREPITVYLVLPAEYLDTCGKWFRLVVASALHELWRGEKGAVPVLVVLDEFAQFGRLAAVQNAMNLARGFGVQLWPILQNLTDLKKLYGENWETFLSGAAIQQYFAANDITTMEYVSKLCGQTTIQLESISTSAVASGGTTGTSLSFHQRPLLLPEQIGQLGDDRFLMRAGGLKNVVLGYRMPYFNTPTFRGMFDPDPYHRRDRNDSGAQERTLA